MQKIWYVTLDRNGYPALGTHLANRKQVEEGFHTEHNYIPNYAIFLDKPSALERLEFTRIGLGLAHC